MTLLSKGKYVFSLKALWQLYDSSHTLQISVMMSWHWSHGHWTCNSHFHHVMALYAFSSASSKMNCSNIAPWHVMTIQTIFKLHLWGVAKIPIPKFSIFLKLDNFAPGSLTVHLKFDFLHWPFLMNSNYAPWKYMSNGVCT